MSRSSSTYRCRCRCRLRRRLHRSCRHGWRHTLGHLSSCAFSTLAQVTLHEIDLLHEIGIGLHSSRVEIEVQFRPQAENTSNLICQRCPRTVNL